MGACFAVRICWLMKLGKAGTVGVIWIAETVDECADEHFHNSVDVNCRNLGLHVLQEVGADHLAKLSH
eukprot:1983155-Pleurochrysis_carterae.AAC.1